MAVTATTSIEKFRFSTDILRRLGEELVPEIDQGILELVKNSYDADAANCTIDLIQEDNQESSLSISDDGLGMTAEDIVNGWLLLGSSSKRSDQVTAKGRTPIGNKGLGRLAALRLGETVTLCTRPKASPGTEFTVHIEWADFDSVQTVDEVPIEIVSTLSDDDPGTTIKISKLNRNLGFREVQRLARGLVLFADPFAHELGFRPILNASEFTDMELLVRNAYFDSADFHLVADLDSKGTVKIRVLDFSGGELWNSGGEEISQNKYMTAPAQFELWNFLLDGKNFATRDVSLGEVRGWLAQVGGVHIYRRNIRVSPYGEPDDDWTGMNRSRVASPEERPSTNNSIGVLRTNDPRDQLFEKTDRSGFVKSIEFEELQRFCNDSLNWMAKKRLTLAESKRKANRAEARPDVQRSQFALQESIEKLPANLREPVALSAKSLISAQVRERRILDQEVQLYRTVASIGTFTAAFAHESKRPAEQIDQMIASVKRRGTRKFGREFTDTLSKPLQIASDAVATLINFAAVPLRLLQSRQRRIRQLNVHDAILASFELFSWHLDRDGVRVETELNAANFNILASPAAIESIATNLITNSINSLNSDDESPAKRVIRVQTSSNDEHITIRFSDSGSGIKQKSLADIWLPGQTTTPNGTGIGLTIVKDTVSDLGGSCEVERNSDLGGAKFTITLPHLGAIT